MADSTLAKARALIEAGEKATPGERYMTAYWFALEPTGCDSIDAILEAIAKAGKGCHSTADWIDYPEEGESYVDLIQRAANEAAAARNDAPSIASALVEAAAILKEAAISLDGEQYHRSAAVIRAFLKKIGDTEGT
jgi:hypothetical protein